ncbi:hypothetical protein [Hyphobacterium sp.]|uniref:hypothetical protein n=1 Tax=Hyphobacterium sp. TaxID=2004662 RepID=UPI003748EAB9
MIDHKRIAFWGVTRTGTFLLLYSSALFSLLPYLNQDTQQVTAVAFSLFWTPGLMFFALLAFPPRGVWWRLAAAVSGTILTVIWIWMLVRSLADLS